MLRVREIVLGQNSQWWNMWRLQFFQNKKRVTVGLGRFDESAAQEAKSNIEHLIEMHSKDRPPQKSTSQWLSSLPLDLYERLANSGLVEARVIVEQLRTILAVMRAYIKGRTDWKKPANYKQAVDKRETFLGRNLPLVGLRRGDVERWHRWMVHDIGMSPNTAGQNMYRCRQMMKAAISDELIERNPFLGVKVNLRSDKSKNRFLTNDMANAVLEACPSQE